MGHGGIQGTVIAAPSSLTLAIVGTLTQAEIRHNLEVPESAFGAAEGCFSRHCERSEAIQTVAAEKVWIASAQTRLAMTA
jgi:hypothetical protein